MSTSTTRLLWAAGIGQLVGMLGWIDPIFVPLVVAGPLVIGAAAALRGIAYTLVGMLWVSAGVNMLWTDYVINHEDVVFHLALTAVMTILSGVGYAAFRVMTRFTPRHGETNLPSGSAQRGTRA